MGIIKEKSREITQVFAFLNSLNGDIQFTMELDHNSSLNSQAFNTTKTDGKQSIKSNIIAQTKQ